MVLTKSAYLLREIKMQNIAWFHPSNKRFFGDVYYRAYYGKKSGNPYLIRATYAWTDMFGQPRKLHYRINRVNPNTKEIEPLIEDTFKDIYEVKTWLRDN